MTALTDVVPLLQQLIRVDTTNPPGNETAAAHLLRDYLEAAGVECELYAKTPERANLDYRAGGPIDVRALPEGDSPVGCRQMVGNVWEWVADTFQPYPGFASDPYKEYSEPHFGEKNVLKGGCWTTRSRLIRGTWRNFFKRQRRNVFAGFRTAAR